MANLQYCPRCDSMHRDGILKHSSFTKATKANLRERSIHLPLGITPRQYKLSDVLDKKKVL